MNLNLIAAILQQRRVVAPPAVVAANGTPLISSFTLTSTSTATVPFAIGHTFIKAAVPTGQVLTLNTATYQVTSISLWDDGSIKHAKVSGTAALTANTPLVVQFGRGSAMAGSALAESNLITAAPTATVAFGTYGTVSLASLLGTSALVLTEQAGSQYAAFQYIANFPNDATVRAVFYVELWAGGAWRSRVGVEGGTALQSGATKSGTATVTINSTVVFTGSVSMDAGCRWDAEGGTFTKPTPSHDPAYLRATKLVPNYGYVSPSSTALNAIQTSYTPMNGMDWPSDQGSVGYDPDIGLMPHWDALYACTGDSRAYASSIAHSRAYGAYGIFFRDTTTKYFPKISDNPNAYSNSENFGATGFNWEVNHHPLAGYMSWLLTGERFFLEVMQVNAWCTWYSCATNTTGTGRTWSSSQTRGRGWRARTMGLAAAVSPTGDLVGNDLRANFGANADYRKTTYVDNNYPATGLIDMYDDQLDGSGIAQPGFQHSIFESLFVEAAWAFTWDAEPGLGSTQKAHHQAVRDFTHRVSVGLCGNGQSNGNFNYRQAPGPYRMTIGPNANDNTTLYSTWGAVALGTFGADGLSGADGLAIGGGTVTGFADDPSSYAFPQGNWGHVLTALSYAVDHGAPLAQAAMTRLTGASNWAANAVKFNDWPQYGLAQRVPAWYSALASGGIKNLGVSYMSGVGPYAGQSGAETSTTALFSYSGMWISNNFFYDSGSTKRVGAALMLGPSGGHNAYSGNEIYGFSLKDQAYYLIRAPFASPVADTQINSDGSPTSRHSYGMNVWCPYTNELFTTMTKGEWGTSGSSNANTHTFSLSNSTPNTGSLLPWVHESSFAFGSFGQADGGATCYDSDNNRMINVTPGQYHVGLFGMVSRAWTYLSGESPGSPQSYSDRLTSCYIPGKQWVAAHSPAVGGPAGGLRVMDMTQGSSAQLTAVTVSGAAAPDTSNSFGLTWDAFNGRLVSCDESGNLAVCTPPSTIGSTWVWTALTTTGDTPETQTWSGEGVWTSFGYVDDGILRGYVGVLGPACKPFFYKL